MAISERTRKMLWGRAAARCALCDRQLVIDPSDVGDREAVVGDECHIVAQHPGGPRSGEPLSTGIDDYENLILLCKADHKRVDDQPAYFTRERLNQLKATHERRIAETSRAPVRLVSDPNHGPAVPRRVQTGGDLWNAISNSQAWRFSHPQPESEAEAEILAAALDSISDWAQVASDLGPGETVRAAFALSEELQALTELGLVVYVAQHRRLLTGGVGSPTPWREAAIWIVRQPATAASDEGSSA